MASDDALPPESTSLDAEPAPELADWWVWAVRLVAGVVAGLLIAARPLILLVVAVKLVLWRLTNDTNEMMQAGAAAAGLIAAWAVSVLLGRFAGERHGPDLDRWLRQRRA